MWDVMEVVVPRYVDVPRCYAWPMTFHTIQFTADKKSFVWVADRYSRFEGGAYGTVAKITHLNEHHVAYSLWGDEQAMNVAEEFAQRVKDGRIVLAEPRAVIEGLLQLAQDFPPSEESDRQYPEQFSREPQLAPRGLLVAHISEKPQVYRLSLTTSPRVAIISGEVSAMNAAGDPWNPAVSFLDYYGRITAKSSIQEILLLGVHMLRVAAANSRGVREIDVWVCENGDFRQLSDEQVEVYIEASKSLDKKVLLALRKAPSLPSA